MELLEGDHQCSPYCLRACTLDVRPAFVEDLEPEDRERYLVEGGGLGFVGNMNYVNLLNLEGYQNQGGVWNHQGRNGDQEPEQQTAEEPAEKPAEEPADEPGLAAAVAQAEQSENPPRRRRQRGKFTALQLRELEDLFQETEYPDILIRYLAGSGGAGSQGVWAHFQAPLFLCRDCSFPSKATKINLYPRMGVGVGMP
ncbi:rhox homeobox family member 1 [Moschus berezovskii]|uniref:rhox homeobox family member 1 n=1 Tax=Moschus berezovskii TaxID=68408 RepID=UPI002444601A|nr:rhox homeobox family member 1 [Moschus berezovskii]